MYASSVTMSSGRLFAVCIMYWRLDCALHVHWERIKNRSKSKLENLFTVVQISYGILDY